MQNIHGLWDIENNFLYETFQNLGLEIYFSSFSNFYLRTFMFRFKEFLVLFDLSKVSNFFINCLA